MVATRTRKPARHPHGRTFVSYAYKDTAALAQLKELHLAGIQLRPFSPISVRPSQMVSTRLLSAIHACSSFIHVDTPNARRSRWVVLETDYARRIGKAVFALDPRQGRVRHDRATPMHLPVFPSYAREDARDVRDILAIMKTERYFDVFSADEEIGLGTDLRATIDRGLRLRLEQGGTRCCAWRIPKSVSICCADCDLARIDPCAIWPFSLSICW